MLFRRTTLHFLFIFIFLAGFCYPWVTFAFAPPNIQEVRCVNLRERERYKELHLTKRDDHRYTTSLVVINGNDQPVIEKLSPSQIFIFRQKVVNLSSLDIIIKFELGTKENPASDARVNLSLKRYRSDKWLCKIYGA